MNTSHESNLQMWSNDEAARDVFRHRIRPSEQILVPSAHYVELLETHFNMNPVDQAKFRARLKQTGMEAILAEHRTTGIVEIIHLDSVHGITPSELAICDFCNNIDPESDLAESLKAFKYTVN